MNKLAKNACIILLALTMLMTTCLSAKASTPGVKILEGDITDETSGLACRATPVYNYGPDDFAVLNDDDIIVLDNLSCRLQHYCGGEFFETIQLPAGQDYLRLFASGRTLYVLARGSLFMIDLDTKKQTEITLPFETEDQGQNIFGLYVNDILEADGKLLLVTEVYGNYALNTTHTAFEKVPSEYSAVREGGLGGKTICVKMGNQHWDIEADDTAGYPIGRNANGDLFMYLLDMDLHVGDKNYCRILKYSSDGELNAVSTVDVSKWAHTPRTFARMAEDGKVYVLGVYADKYIVYKLEVGSADISEPERPVPEMGMDPAEQEQIREEKGGAKAAPNVTLSRSTVQTRALGMINLTWTYSNGNNRWSEYGATAPHHLASASMPSTQTGIPYCYGKMNGYATVSGGTKFSSIITTVDPNNSAKRLYAAGNILSSTKSGTVGVDCASFAASAYGYSSLATTGDFASSSYFTTISQSNLMRMDIIVKSGYHAMLFKEVSSTSSTTLVVYECLVDNTNDKTRTNTRTLSYLNSTGYTYRRPNSWVNCTHSSIASNYSYDSTEHWKACQFCDYKTNLSTHSFVLQSNGTYKCSVCHYITGTPVTSVLPEDH